MPEKKEEKKVAENNVDKSSVKKKKTYKVIFKQNRTKEIYVAGQKIVFSPNEVKTGIDSKIVNHPDFQSQKKYFNILEG